MTDVPDGILDEGTISKFDSSTKIKINHEMIMIRYLFSSSTIGTMK